MAPPHLMSSLRRSLRLGKPRLSGGFIVAGNSVFRIDQEGYGKYEQTSKD